MSRPHFPEHTVADTLNPMPPTHRIRLGIIAASVALLAASLLLPALQFHLHHDQIVTQPAIAAAPTYPPAADPPPPPPVPPDVTLSHTGLTMLLGGIFGPFKGNFAVLANPLLVFGWMLILAGHFRKAAIACGVAILFALQTFQLSVSGFYEDEGGSNIAYLTHPLIGWYLWVAAMLLPFAAALYFRRMPRSAGGPFIAASSR